MRLFCSFQLVHILRDKEQCDTLKRAPIYIGTPDEALGMIENGKKRKA